MKSRTNRTAKDRVFQMLFDSREKLLELFNALEGTDYTDPTLVNINTLKDALYNTMINDISFSIGMCYIVLTEHQSTDNENMPLRMLLYISRVLEKILDLNELLKKKLYKIPTPHFYVLYNGLSAQPPVWELRLSHAFQQSEKNPMLELVVKVININAEERNPILEKSPTLYGYSHFVKLIRVNVQKGMKRDEAIDAAVATCIKEGVLVDFLQEHAAEVTNAMFNEITVEDALRIRGEEERQEGREEGREEGERRINRLNQMLIRDGKTQELIRAAGNSEYQEELLKEYGI